MTNNCTCAEEAQILDVFLRCNEHSASPRSPVAKTRDRTLFGANNGGQQLPGNRRGGSEFDSLNHKTTADVYFAKVSVYAWVYGSWCVCGYVCACVCVRVCVWACGWSQFDWLNHKTTADV